MAPAEALRAARKAVLQAEIRDGLRALEWGDPAQEIGGLPRRDRRELSSRVMTDYRACRETAVQPGGARSAGEDVIRDSPSLRGEKLPR